MNRSIDNLDPIFKAKVEKLEPYLKKYGWFITESLRSQDRQNELFYQGYSQTLNSMHTKGQAIDIASNGSELYPSDMKQWRKIADIAKGLNIDWGYDMWGWDMPHFQCDGAPLGVKIPEWAVEDWEKLKPYLDKPSPMEELTPEAMQWILFKLGVIKEVSPIPMYRFSVILRKLGLLP